MNKSQKENTAKTFLDLAKALVIIFVIGGLIPDSPITWVRIIWAILIACVLYLGAMFLLKEVT